MLLRLGGRTIVDISGYQIEISAYRVVCTLDHDLHGKIHYDQTPGIPSGTWLLIVTEISSSRASALLAIHLPIRQTRRIISGHVVI